MHALYVLPGGPKDLDRIPFRIAEIEAQTHPMVEGEADRNGMRLRVCIERLERGEALHLPGDVSGLRPRDERQGLWLPPVVFPQEYEAAPFCQTPLHLLIPTPYTPLIT